MKVEEKKQIHKIKVRELIELKNKLGLSKNKNNSLTCYDWKSESHSIDNFPWRQYKSIVGNY